MYNTEQPTGCSPLAQHAALPITGLTYGPVGTMNSPLCSNHQACGVARSDTYVLRTRINAQCSDGVWLVRLSGYSF